MSPARVVRAEPELGDGTEGKPKLGKAICKAKRFANFNGKSVTSIFREATLFMQSMDAKKKVWRRLDPLPLTAPHQTYEMPIWHKTVRDIE